MEFRVFYDGEGAIQRLEWSNIPGLSYEEADRTVWEIVEVLPTTAQEAAEVLRAIDLTTPSQFSYREDLQTIETSGYAKKTDGFQNSAPREHSPSIPPPAWQPWRSLRRRQTSQRYFTTRRPTSGRWNLPIPRMTTSITPCI